ncbi:3-carboxy-cis,cis-muconate cycloisomerase [Nibrella saemangeumensis]|uniref:3-carboxy-cis,cis-muconate cycloisomerase n=1 Tax=Nibrella saemangeumensis TaxID=1084526 RepID=A0ABP8NIL3_9BACT
MSLYSDLFYSAEIRYLFSEGHAVDRMLQVEAALAGAQAAYNIVPPSVADVIQDCCRVELISMGKLKEGITLSGNVAIPLVKQLTQLVQERDPEAARYVHLGATSQDIVDTATVLQIQAYLEWIKEKLIHLENLLVVLTRRHRQTPMIGRTLLQQAKPITFGLKTAYWLDGVSRSKSRLEETKKRVLVVQLAGAAGSQNSHIPNEVKEAFAHILDLDTANSWHTQRDNLAELASVLGILNGSLGKIAKDVSLLMQTEIAEVLEGKAEGKGGSSTMPHKRNPVTCTAILANANRVPNLVATMLAAMPQENERSAGLWHSEWEVLRDIMQLTAGTVERSLELLSQLEVDDQRMRRNLEVTNGLIYAETVSLALAPKLGKAQAHALVEKACALAIDQQKHLKEVLFDQHVDLPNLEDLFKPENSIGQSLNIIDTILHQHESGKPD